MTPDFLYMSLFMPNNEDWVCRPTCHPQSPAPRECMNMKEQFKILSLVYKRYIALFNNRSSSLSQQAFVFDLDYKLLISLDGRQALIMTRCQAVD